ncbi:ATP-binding protein [bacterium]|nr:ATP-binding protein [bacterium]
MSNAEFYHYIHHGSEERNLEYKCSMNWDSEEIKSKITKTCIAMSNLPDGGVIVLGVKEIEKDVFYPEGMLEQDYNSFNQDNVQHWVNNHADPYVLLTVKKIEVENLKYIVIQIKEFDLYPVICKKDSVTINEGEIYCRPKRKNESVKIPSQNEMREILELGVKNAVRKNLYQCHNLIKEVNKELDTQDNSNFEKEIEDL